MSVKSRIATQTAIISKAASAKRQVAEWADREIAAARKVIQAEVALLLLPTHGILDHEDLYLGNWECETSPTGGCVYNEGEDRDHDFCLFCGEPSERK